MQDPLAIGALGLPDVPGPDADLYIDAAAKCFARHGLRRTKVTDIADEVGVSRVTVYRQIGTIDRAARLLLARELDRLLSELVPRVLAAATPEDIVDVIASAVRFAIEHPVLSKVLRDEPDLVGGFVVAELDTLLARLRLLANPVLARLASLQVSPAIAMDDLADCITRLLVTVVISPPASDLRQYLQGVLGPLLQWPAAGTATATARPKRTTK